MKRLKTLLINFVLVVQLLALASSSLPIFAEEIPTKKDEQPFSVAANEETTSSSLQDKEPEKTEESKAPEVKIPTLKQNTLQPLSSNVAEVKSWEDLVVALGNQSVTSINITADFAVPTGSAWREGLVKKEMSFFGDNNSSNNAVYGYMNKAKISRKIVIEGNNHELDFGAVTLCFNALTTDNASPWDITWQNMKVYSGNYYGFSELNDLNTSDARLSYMRYKNVENIGNQMIHSPNTNVTMEGIVTSTMVERYTSQFHTDWRTNDSQQVNVYASNLTIEENSTVTLRNYDGSNISLANSAFLTLEENAKLYCYAPANERGGGETEGKRYNVFIKDGNVDIGENAEMYLYSPAGRTKTLLNLEQAGTTFHIHSGGKLQVESEEHTSGDHLIVLGAQSKLLVDGGGQLIVKGSKMGNSQADGIRIANGGQNQKTAFELGKDSILDVSTDSTNNESNPIELDGSNTKFVFADAQKVDIRREKALSAVGWSTPLIQSDGQLRVDIQKVSQWQIGEFGDVPTYHWAPMYNVNIQMRGSNEVEVQSASSINISISEDFRQRFKLKSQRILFEYVDDAKIRLDSQATDNNNDSSSHVVRGHANPEAYVRITDKPIVAGTPSAIADSEQTIPSPVEEDSSDTSKNFTVIADNNGDFSFDTAGRFKAGSILTAYVFVMGKETSTSQVVLDKTAPTGKPRTLHWAVDWGMPTPESFVENPQDTNPLPQNFTYAFVDENVVKQAMQNLGTHLIDVYIYDEAKNQGEVKGAKVTFYPTASMINGEDIEISQDVLQDNFADEQKLKNYIVEQAKPKDDKQLYAQAIINNQLVDLSSYVEMNDLQGLNYQSPVGDHKVILKVPVNAGGSGLTSEMTKEITVRVTVTKLKPTKPIEPTNPVAPTDKEPNAPVDGSENDGTGVTGNLRMSYLPSMFDFGEVTSQYGEQSMFAMNPKNTAGQEITRQWLEVYDTQSISKGWTVSIALTSPFLAADGSTLKGATLSIPKGHTYNTHVKNGEAFTPDSAEIKTEDVILSDDGVAKEILSAKDAKDITTKVWNADKVKLMLPSTVKKETKAYKSTVNWTLIAGVTN
ncbi:MAG: WxL domain-containing protein [Lactobacillales bacterium]|jgi:hypothetical protein|nr:WxL domain-containing protein [Lactobacillales bacterium]